LKVNQGSIWLASDHFDEGDKPMTTRTLIESLRDFIARRRVLAMRRTAIEQIARQPGHLAADVNVPRRYAPAGITVVIVMYGEHFFDSSNHLKLLISGKFFRF